MSASNWAVCPRCVARARAAATRAAAGVAESYGRVPPAEYDRAVQAVPQVREADYRTFAEYYEIYGAQTGTVTVSYGAGCEVCGLELSFTSKHPVPGLEEPS